MARGHVIHVERRTDCPFSIVQSYVEEYLCDARRGGKNAFVSAGIFRRRVDFRFETRSDTAETGRSHEEIVLHWFSGTLFLPNFDGTLRMRIASPGTLLVLEGRNTPPNGALGTLFDRLFGRRIARVMAHALLAHIARTLAERERKWREDSDTFPTPANR